MKAVSSAMLKRRQHFYIENDALLFALNQFAGDKDTTKLKVLFWVES